MIRGLIAAFAAAILAVSGAGLAHGNPASAATSYQWCTTDPFGAKLWNGPGQHNQITYNNEWNTGAHPGYQEMCANNPSDVRVTSKQRAGNTEVLTYPAIQKNYHDIAISRFSDLRSTFTITQPGVQAGDDEEFAADDWLNHYSIEVMIWVNNHGQTPAGQKIGEATIYGQHFNVFGSGNSLFSFVLDHRELAGTIHHLSALRWLRSHGYIQGSDKLGQEEIGWEICSTGGQYRTFTLTRNHLISSYS